MKIADLSDQIRQLLYRERQADAEEHIRGCVGVAEPDRHVQDSVRTQAKARGQVEYADGLVKAGRRQSVGELQVGLLGITELVLEGSANATPRPSWA